GHLTLRPGYAGSEGRGTVAGPGPENHNGPNPMRARAVARAVRDVSRHHSVEVMGFGTRPARRHQREQPWEQPPALPSRRRLRGQRQIGRCAPMADEHRAWRWSTYGGGCGDA